MVKAAKEKGLDARVVDGQSLDFDSEFDAVFSNAGALSRPTSGANHLRPSASIPGDVFAIDVPSDPSPALHWMKQDPDAVIKGARRALKPGGRFVGEFGGHGNVAAIVVALSAALMARGIDPGPRHPWYFPSAEEYSDRLEAAGFRVTSIQLFSRPTRLPSGIAGWLVTFAGPWLHGLPQSVQDEVLAHAKVCTAALPPLS